MRIFTALSNLAKLKSLRSKVILSSLLKAAVFFAPGKILSKLENLNLNVITFTIWTTYCFELPEEVIRSNLAKRLGNYQ